MNYKQEMALARELNKSKSIQVETTNAYERDHNSDADLYKCMIGIRRNKAVIEVK